MSHPAFIADWHRAVQQATLEQISSASRTTREQLLEEDSEIFGTDDLTFLTCD